VEPITRTQLDRAKLLVGSVLTGVRYFEPAFDLAINGQWDFDVVHVAQLGVELTTDWGFITLVSSNEFTEGGFELELLAQSVSDGLGHAE